MLNLASLRVKLSAGVFLALLLSSCSWMNKASTTPSATNKYVVAEDNGFFQISTDGNSWVAIKPAESEIWNTLVV